MQALAEKVDRELAVLTTQQREQGEGLHNSLEQLRAAVLPKVQTEIDRLDERVSAIEEGPDKLEEVQLGATTSKDSHRIRSHLSCSRCPHRTIASRCILS